MDRHNSTHKPSLLPAKSSMNTPIPKRNPIAIVIFMSCLAWIGLCLMFWHAYHDPNPAPPPLPHEILDNPSNWSMPDFEKLQKDAATPAEQAIIDETLKEWNRMTNR